ncbi:MAG: 2-amino-4-hydroxy-6-hydroxymethyldihydropteridine diphosphokinase [Fibrobacter sp.]|nr:2-amino-4-hydroxy-6-hydroxymethyldihydropteridine diphosphokinase [Fibrobacter sp.]
MNSFEQVYIALGTNLPNRWEHLAHGRQMLSKVSLGNWTESPIYETPPIGAEGQGPYFNQVVGFRYGGTPSQLLYYLKGAEYVLGRKDRGHWNSREIDLDLLYFGDKVCDGIPTVPHSQIGNRQFVLVPLKDIAPDFRDPRSGCTVVSMLDSLLQREDSIEFRVITSEEP